MGMFGKFTERAQKAIMLAQDEALKLKHSYIGTEHILLGIMAEGEGIGAQVLEEAGLDLEKLVNETVEIVGMGEEVVEIAGHTPRTKKVFELSVVAARNLGHNYVGTEHLLLGLLDEGEGVAIVILSKLGVDVDDLADGVLDKISENISTGQQGEGPNQQTKTPNLDKFSIDLNKRAKSGNIDPVIGRQKEIERVVQVLSRRTKNNPVLIGEPGVGKTAIAEGLAQKIVEGNVPEIIKNKTIRSLDLPSMIAGAKYRGEFEERLKDVMEELKKDTSIILFIDEFHTIVGAGAAEGAIDASNILKPALARGDLQVIGATTIDEYRKNIEKDTALERRLQPIMVDEPTVEDTILILQGLRDKYEAHHRVKITDEAINAASELSARYISDRFLPDKAIDLIDEAASMIRIRSYMAPDNLKEIEEKLDLLASEKEEAINNQNYEKAANIRDEERELREKLQNTRDKWDEDKTSNTLKVGYDEIASIVSDWTKIPVTKMTMAEGEKLLNLEKTLHERVIGQEEAVDSISKAVRRARVGLKNPNKPVGSFLFVGPTGVGKTHLAKALSKELFGDEDSMIRVDMSEYMEKHSVSKLVGSPPGYVGFDDGGQLTEAVRRKPYSVILFDEIEKAHPDVFNILLQILDDGRLTDSKGRTVDFKNTVIIMTSNVGARDIKKKNTLGFATGENQSKAEHETMKEIIFEELKRTFRPEFLNRLDEVIVFHSLKEENIREIVDLMIRNLEERLKDLEISLEISDEVRDHISKVGYDQVYGARPLERTIRDLIEDRLAEEFLRGNIDKKDIILVEKGQDDKLEFKAKPVV